MATRRFCCLTEAGVTPMARSRNQVAWSKRDTYICEFMWLVKSYSDARTAPLNVWIHSDMSAFPFLLTGRLLGFATILFSGRQRRPTTTTVRDSPYELRVRSVLLRILGPPVVDGRTTIHAVHRVLLLPRHALVHHA